MANLIPNENTWVGFVAATPGSPDGVADIDAPTVAEVNGAVDVTDYLVSLTSTTQGNTVPTPRLKRLFEPNIEGTAAAQFTGDFYRDDENDLAWDTFPRRTRGCFLISRFGGTGADHKPAAGDTVEVWPVRVASRAPGGLQSNQAQMFTVTCAVPKEPNEDAVVVA